MGQQSDESILYRNYAAWAQSGKSLTEIVEAQQLASGTAEVVSDAASEMIEHTLLHFGGEAVTAIAQCHPVAGIGLSIALLGGSLFAEHELSGAVRKFLGDE